jgi:adenosylcobyric acid synthase
MGVTSSREEVAFGDDGAVAKNGLVIGTYLHGIFENENFRNAFLDYLYRRKNLVRGQVSTPAGDGFSNLARAVEANLDMEKIWRMFNLNA